MHQNLTVIGIGAMPSTWEVLFGKPAVLPGMVMVLPSMVWAVQHLAERGLG